MKNKGYIKLSKALFECNKFKKLSNSSKLLLIYLILMADRFKNTSFYRFKSEIDKSFKISRMGLWRCSKELKSLKIKITCQNKNYHFDLTNFFNTFMI